MTPGPDFVQSLERGLAVIRAFDADHPELTLSDVARATGLTRAAARRFLLTLAELGYVRTDGRRFALTARVLELGYAYLSALSLPEVATPHLERLVAEVRESSSLSVLDGDDIVYVARTTVNRVMAVDLHIGSRLPAYCTSMGRILLAYLPPEQLEAYLARVVLTPHTTRTVTSVDKLRMLLRNVRRNGYALCDQEYEVGLRSLAVPVFAPNGRAVATINLSGNAPRISALEMQTRFLPHLRNAANELAVFLR
jgi:IclR family transcriptional regulator, pca regulon regulatory protein